MARVLELAEPRRSPFPDAGLAWGWEIPTLTALTLLILSFGLVTLYSASAFQAQRAGLPDTYFVLRQATGATLGLMAMVLCARMPYQIWKSLAWPLLGLTWFLLVLLVLPGTQAIAPEVNGARRWLRLGVSFQPSELAKIAIIVWSAALCVRKAPQFKRLSQGLAPFLVVWAALLIPVLLQPDLSTAAVMGMLGAVVVFAGGARVGHFLFLGLLGAPVLVAQLRVGFRWERLLAFLNPADHADGAGFQVLQSLIAVGSGGLTGLGFGEGRQKFGFLPEAQNDFIFAMVGEEWGLLGVSFLTVLYLALVAVGFRVASRAPDLFGRLLAIGFSSFIAIHAFLHMAVGLALVPPTGLPLPLVSFGRTNLIVTLVGLGILLSVARGCQDGDERPCKGNGEIDLLWDKAQVSSPGGRLAALKGFFGYGSHPLAGGSRG